MHTSRLQEKYYNLLKSGVKTIEIRINDEKRRTFREKNLIKFSNRSNPEDTFTAEIIKLHFAKDFEELCKTISPQQVGFDTTEELIEVLEEFYSLEEQKLFGVVGIEMKVVLLP